MPEATSGPASTTNNDVEAGLPGPAAPRAQGEPAEGASRESFFLLCAERIVFSVNTYVSQAAVASRGQCDGCRARCDRKSGGCECSRCFR